ncbi:MAG: response regulator [Actinobacteria bacterium]|nr:response regulator [Actinomycetota bacterium]
MSDCRVLVVEDDLDSREAMIDLLAVEGYDVCGARDGKEALEVLRGGKFQPDVIVLDLYMPSMNGQELRAALQAEARWKHIPVIVCTGTLSAPPQPGAFDTLEKPIDVDALLAVVRRGCAVRNTPDQAMSA